MAVSFSVLFTRLGKIFAAQGAINTARGTTIPPKVKAITDEFDDAALNLQQAISVVESAADSVSAGATGGMSALQSGATNLIVEMMNDDTALPSKDITTALALLIAQMVAGPQSVDASTVSASASAITGNGNGVLVVSAKRADGLANENLFAETITLQCTNDASPERATFTVTSPVAVLDQLSELWPGKSGLNTSLTATDPDGSLLGNGSFDEETTIANAPDDWIVSVGTIGTTLKMTDYEVQRITVTGTPSAGTYTVSWANQASKTQTTAPLPYDASSADLQAALRDLDGLDAIEVATSAGTTPNFTHDITFTGVAGNLSQVTVANSTTGGTFTPSTVSGGSANAFVGKAIEFDSDGSQLTTINRLVSLQPLKQYAFNCFILADVVPAAGVITIDLVDGIGGSVIADAQATNNSFTITCSGLSTSFAARNGAFRTPRVLPPIVYLRIRISTAVSGGTSIFIDHAALTEMSELYVGGPWAQIFSGSSPFTKGDTQITPDYFTIAAANNGVGLFQQYFERNFSMREKGLLLPSNAAAGETIDDALIS